MRGLAKVVSLMRIDIAKAEAPLPCRVSRRLGHSCPLRSLRHVQQFLAFRERVLPEMVGSNCL